MSSGDSKPLVRTRPVRIVVLINLALLVALFGPLNSHELYLAETRAGVANFITLALQVWFVGSTLLATVIFVRQLTKKSDRAVQQKRKFATLDGFLLAGWWIVVIVVCLYAFMIGMAG